MLFINIKLCSLLGLTNWLHNHLIPCPFKALTSYDCPGCGFQRSILAILNGNVKESLDFYPATIPLIIVFSFVILDSRFGFDQKHHIKKSLYMFTGMLIIGSYIAKMAGHPF